MPCPNLTAAVTEFFRREAEDMRKPHGADHAELFEVVAHEFGVDTAALTEKVLDLGMARPN